jgi:uncharacterized protein YbcV (DUF1398 family)
MAEQTTTDSTDQEIVKTAESAKIQIETDFEKHAKAAAG